MIVTMMMINIKTAPCDVVTKRVTVGLYEAPDRTLPFWGFRGLDGFRV